MCRHAAGAGRRSCSPPGGAHAPQRPAPYLDVDLAGLVARLTRPPRRVEVPVICDEQLVVEHHSR
nr:hypothetical protein [Micromonospora sp. KC207]